MKTTLFTTTLLALLLQANATITPEQAHELQVLEDKCVKKSGGSVFNAVGKFCSQAGKLMVPSEYAKKGSDGYDNKVHISIDGSDCQSWGGPQYIPYEWCLEQFMEICVAGNAQGGGEGHYGWNGFKCQHWVIKAGDYMGQRQG